MRPIEGIRPVVDLNTMEVIRVDAHGNWPLPLQIANFAVNCVSNQRTDIRAIENTQPDGQTATVHSVAFCDTVCNCTLPH